MAPKKGSQTGTKIASKGSVSEIIRGTPNQGTWHSFKNRKQNVLYSVLPRTAALPYGTAWTQTPAKITATPSHTNTALQSKADRAHTDTLSAV